MILEKLKQQWFTICAGLILGGICFALGWHTNERLVFGDPAEHLIRSAYRQIAGESILNEQSNEELGYAAIRGMLDVLNDPYAELIEPDAAQNFRNTFSGKTGVVGLYIVNENNLPVIAIVFPGGAAEQAGLQVGDVVQEIDGRALDQASDSSEVGLLLRGAPGTDVRLNVKRGEQAMDVVLTRKEQQFVTSRMLPDGTGYIHLAAYNETAAQQMKTALEELIAQQPGALIWDLRNNEGGDMLAAQTMLSYFIEDGLLFTGKLTNERSVAFRAKGGALAADLPLVVLMDLTTYSAAETCSATIAESGRGTTIGSTSHGKGIIQATVPLVDGAMLQMTVAKWLSPSGEWYHGRGVPPQIEVLDDPATDTDEVLERALAFIQAKQ